MKYFTQITSRVTREGQKSAVVMGRKTWESIPPKYKPLANRINYVLTSRKDGDYTGAIAYPSLHKVIEDFTSKGDDVDQLWAIGGTAVYNEALKNPNFYRAYITRVYATFQCDTFLPGLPEGLVSVTDPDVPSEEQQEGDIKYKIEVLGKD